jgi:Tfp pilus assembly protein PilN
MIRVNLLQNRVRGQGMQGATSTGTATDMKYGTSGGTSTMLGAPSGPMVVNLIALLLFPAALIYYEQYNIGILQAQANALTADVQQIQTALTAKETLLSQSGELKEKAKELATKIELLKKLARTRLREVKSLDFIQTNLPEKVWLHELAFKSGAVVIKGKAMTDDDLTSFVRSLEKSRTFTKVLLLQAREERTTEGAVKNFEVTCNVEAE